MPTMFYLIQVTNVLSEGILVFQRPFINLYNFTRRHRTQIKNSLDVLYGLVFHQYHVNTTFHLKNDL